MERPKDPLIVRAARSSLGRAAVAILGITPISCGLNINQPPAEVRSYHEQNFITLISKDVQPGWSQYLVGRDHEITVPSDWQINERSFNKTDPKDPNSRVSLTVVPAILTESIGLYLEQTVPAKIDPVLIQVTIGGKKATLCSYVIEEDTYGKKIKKKEVDRVFFPNSDNTISELKFERDFSMVPATTLYIDQIVNSFRRILPKDSSSIL